MNNDILYLCAFQANLPGYNVDYNDILKVGNVNIVCDCFEVDIDKYNYLIATPPCNYYSKANINRLSSSYALNTKHILPGILEKFALSGKPFIVENVRNKPLFIKEGIFDICNKYNIFVYYYGRHTYFTNMLTIFNVYQKPDFIEHKNSLHRQGGVNVNNVLLEWLYYHYKNY